MEALVETHSRLEALRALDAGASIIGVTPATSRLSRLTARKSSR